MPIPFYRSEGDDRDYTWYEWVLSPVFVPVFVILLGVASLLAIPYFALYPDHAARGEDFGAPRQQELMRRFRRCTARVGLFRRCARLLGYPCRRRRLPRRAVRVARTDTGDGGPV